MTLDLIDPLLDALISECSTRNWKLITAESCTGGLLASTCTLRAGSSTWFEGGVVSYSNALKHQILGVRTLTLSKFGAVSEMVVQEMIKGVLQLGEANLAIAITGIAGPSGGTATKPVGTVWIGWGERHSGWLQSRCYQFTGTRTEIQFKAMQTAFTELLRRLQTTGDAVSSGKE